MGYYDSCIALENYLKVNNLEADEQIDNSNFIRALDNFYNKAHDFKSKIFQLCAFSLPILFPVGL